ncbi:MAG TPA: response regulator [Candidatus Lokiarchaeia archaeon]
MVEDDISLQRLYKMILEASGYNIQGIANNGEEAVKMYQSFAVKPEIVLMDHRMPIKNGIEATKEILQISNHSKIIFASADNSVKKLALSIGAIRFLEKPFELKVLVEEIAAILKKA